MDEINGTFTIESIGKLMTRHPDFPKKGINFLNVLPILRHPAAFAALIDFMCEKIKAEFHGIEAIAGLDARGFLFATPIALKLNLPIVCIRKKGKLPGETYQFSFEKEYGPDVFEIEKNALKPGQKVLLVDDLLATGGSLQASQKLVEKTGAVYGGSLIVVELDGLKGRERLPKGSKCEAMFHGD